MRSKSIFKFFLLAIFVMGILNYSYADSGPTIGANQAKKIAQDYLNSHNLPYRALTPGGDAWKAKVKDTKTGAEKWIPVSDAIEDSPDFGGPGKYEWVSGYNTAWVVQINDKNRKNVGRIYVDAENGKVLKAILDPVAQTDQNQSTSTNTTNASTPASQGPSDNNAGIMFGIIILIIVMGAGYFIYRRM